MNKLFDYIFLMRPTLMIPVWTIALLGARAALWRERGVNPITIDRFPFVSFVTGDLNLLLMLALSSLLVGGIYILNQIYDVDTDRLNKKLFLISEGHVTLKEAWTLYFALTGIALVGAFIFNWQLGCLFVVGAWFGLQYSHPKFNLREHPYKSFRNNAAGIGTLAFLFGWVMYLNFNIEGLIKSIPYFLAVGAVYLNTTLPDLSGDSSSGKQTYASSWGVAKTQRIAIYFLLSGLVFSIMAADYGYSITAAISLPFFIMASISQSVELSALASKVAILLLSLFAAFFFPVYAVIFLFVIVLAKLYYARRFQINYPALMEKK